MEKGPERPVELAGASHEVRRRCACACCGRVRLTTRTNLGPACNECLCAHLGPGETTKREEGSR